MIWLPVVGFPAYEVSNTGLVRAKLGRVRLTPARNQKGFRVRLIRAGRAHDKRLGVVVIEAFVSPRPSLSHKCTYRDGDKTNFHAKNLRWAKTTGP